MKQFRSRMLGAMARLGLRLVLATLFGGALAGTAAAQDFLASQIERLVSTETLTVEIDGLSGALSGNVRIASVTVADRNGVFLTARDLALDWSPLAVVRARIAVERLTAGQIVLERLPETAPTGPDAASVAGLPNLTADIRRITVAEFVLGEAVAGVPAQLRANASLVLEKDPVRLETAISVERLDQPGKIAADLVFAPADNRLEITVDASEPAGGLVANLLELPDAPPVALTINGSGPLGDFMANGALTVDAEAAATLTARVSDVAEGRRVAASLSVTAERFVPEVYTSYVDGGADLDIDVLLRSDGVVAIDRAQLNSGQITGTVSGTLDRAGPLTDLGFALSSRDGSAIPLRFGTEGAKTAIDIAAAEGKVSGPLTAAAVSLTATLPTAGYAEFVASDLTARVGAEGFDLLARSGPIAIELAAASVVAPEGVAERFLEGPVRIVADGALTAGGIALATSRVTTDVANAAISGTAAFDFSTFDLTLASDFETLALSAAAVPLGGERLSVAGSLARAADGAVTARDLAVRGTGLAIDGSAGLAGGSVTADVAGTIDAADAENAAIAGKAEFALTVDGPVEQPDVDITLNSQGLRVNGRELADLKVEARGAFVGALASGTVAISGTLDGTPLSGTGELVTLPTGERRISGLAIRQGPNVISGGLTLTEALVPIGTLDVAVADVGPLAALALQKMSGDLNGTLVLSVNADDFPLATVALASNRLAIGGNTLVEVAIDLAVEDYLGKPFPAGTIQADRVEAAGATIEALALNLSRQGDFTRLDATARANGVPVAFAGQAEFTPTETTLALDSFTAAVPGAPVALRERAIVTIVDGVTRLGSLTLDTGRGSIALSGTAGQTLDLAVTLTDVPAAVANPFVLGLDAAGTLSGNAEVGGAASDPEASFEVSAAGVETRHTRAAGLPPIDAVLSGRYRGGTLDLRTASVDLGEGSVSASGRIGETLDLAVDLDAVPVALANGFVAGLDASGTVSGSARATGTLADPMARFDLTGTGITAAEVAAAGIPPVALDLAGAFAARTLTLDSARATVGAGSLTAVGTIGAALNLQLALTDLPVGLANGFVPGLGATGTLSGTATATGSLSDPDARFEVTGRRITSERVAAAGIPPLTVALEGSVADRTVTIGTARVDVGTGSLVATGKVGETLDLAVALNAIPVALANDFVPGLGASGVVSGTARATGSVSDPTAIFDLSGTDITAVPVAAAGLAPFAFTLDGRYAGGTATIRAARAAVGEGSIEASGTVGRTLDLAIDIRNLPASLASAAAGGLAPSGSIDGSVRATGPIADPSVTYRLDIGGFSVGQTRDAGIGAIDIAARGGFANKVLTVAATLSGSGLAFDASGSVDLAGAPRLDLRLEGTAPLAILNRGLAEGGRSVRGSLAVDVSVRGPTSAPDVTGTISTSGASFTDAGANLAVTAIAATIDLRGQTATIRSFNGNIVSGGTLAIGGTVGLRDGFPADLAIRIADGRYNDGEVIAARLGAELTLTGPITATPLLAGTLDMRSIDILVPERLPTSLARIDVRHRNASAAVLKQQREIAPKRARGMSAGGLSLDLTLNAPNRVFVRGRGLDAELGGSVQITGSAAAPAVTGGFALRRGRFTILGNRFDFERGRLSFTGELVPTIDLLATATAGDVTVEIAVTGPARDPSFNFSSTPALPEDEVLGRLIFGQGTADLSPLQIAQLAEAAAQLAGVGGSTGLLENLRSQLGVDDLDIKTNADGQTAVGVGKYLNDNTYLGVDSSGRVSIDLDLGAGLKARGAVSPTGGGEVGVFYEKEY